MKPPGARGRRRRRVLFAVAGGVAMAVIVGLLASSRPVVAIAAAVGVAMAGVLVQIMIWTEQGPGDSGGPPPAGAS